MKLKYKKMTIFFVIILAGFLYWVNYIITAESGMATYTKGFESEKVSTYKIVWGDYDPALARIDEYAQLSHIVYREGKSKNINTVNNWEKLDVLPENTASTDPDRKVRAWLIYELWKLEEKDQSTVAIVFRGTTVCGDWYANLRWFWKHINNMDWDHYDQLNMVLNSIVDSIEKKHVGTKKLKIVTTGHSLGGGLAQYAAYLHPDIKYVYAFDPSPVTGYYSVEKSVRIKNKKGVIIYRMFESGEGLSFVRKFMTFLYPAPLFKTKDPALIRIRFSFSIGKDAISQHSMCHLAQNLRNIKYGLKETNCPKE